MNRHNTITEQPAAGGRRNFGSALLSVGFRPLFFGAGVFAVLGMVLWLMVLAGGARPTQYYPGALWHSHEMLFGYTVAVIAGFLLTAVRNWSSRPTASGAALAALFVLWLFGRALPFLPWIPGWLIAATDLAFLPALAFAITRPLLRARQFRNLVFVPILALLAAANLAVHLQLLGLADDIAGHAITLALYLIMLLVTVIGGRVIPFFTERAVAGHQPRRFPVIEILAPATIIALAALEVSGAPSAWLAAVAGVGALCHASRVAAWHSRRIWSLPLLWILYLGYGWLAVGLSMTAFGHWGWIPSPAAATHAYTAGCIGSLTLGMMVRVSLGHTGRALVPAPAVVLAFVLVNLAAAVRELAPLLTPQWYSAGLTAAGVLWSLAFGLFVAVMAPIWWAPRVQQA